MSLPQSAAPSRASSAWRPTLAHTRAGSLAFVLAGLAAVLGRSDLLVLATPFAVAFAWGQVTRPDTPLGADLVADRTQVREGERLTIGVRVTRAEHLDAVAVSLRPSDHVAYHPDGGAALVDAHLPPPVSAPDSRVRVRVQVEALRWGMRTVGPGLVGGVSPFGAYRFGPTALPASRFLSLPRPAPFDTTAPVPHPRGLVGQHRASRPGEGAEFYAIREFQVGDRIRRVHWPRSLREGRLHVRATHADQDAHVSVVLDAHQDLGSSNGPRSASTLDHGVRSAAAVSEHFLASGDRVGLSVLSAHHRRPVRPAGGRRQLVRILSVLATTTAMSGREEGPVRERVRAPHGGLVVLISPLVSPDVAGLAAGLSRSGSTVLVVDVLTPGVLPESSDPAMALAWRIRSLEREEEIHALRAVGVPVVPWKGSGSLDLVLRGLARRGPRVAR